MNIKKSFVLLLNFLLLIFLFNFESNSYFHFILKEFYYYICIVSVVLFFENRIKFFNIKKFSVWLHPLNAIAAIFALLVLADFGVSWSVNGKKYDNFSIQAKDCRSSKGAKLSTEKIDYTKRCFAVDNQYLSDLRINKNEMNFDGGGEYTAQYAKIKSVALNFLEYYKFEAILEKSR